MNSRSTPDSQTHALSFDVEHWHSATLLADEVSEPVDRIEESVTKVLDLLDRHDVRATFFVVGRVAEAYPALVRKIDEAGHEIGSHGHTHTPLFDLSPRAFEEELTDSATALEAATGARPVGFRAPNFSVTRDTDWAVRVLEASEYEYDSSVFPVKTPMYGVSGAPVRPYVATESNPFTERPTGVDDGIVEIPVAVADSRFRLPVAGGFYGRVLPTWVLARCIRWRERQGVPAVLYFHPWEFNPAVRTDSPPITTRFVSYYGIEKATSKLDELLDTFEWGTVGAIADRFRSEEPRGPNANPTHDA
ncbi:polysaccharide deacetylase family protein [Haloarchaeobius sp. DFWS5]|uniref:polysaccharide deacetylase family protein n=1 Tax=Haloarchaeobius sp. DFWS5 TaxID=3446114 RepID=UPI003EBC2956